MAQVNNNALPYNLEAEQSVLGAILIDMECQFEIVSKLKESDFFLESHKLIFASMSAISAANKPIDVVTLSDDMEKRADVCRQIQISRFRRKERIRYIRRTRYVHAFKPYRPSTGRS